MNKEEQSGRDTKQRAVVIKLTGSDPRRRRRFFALLVWAGCAGLVPYALQNALQRKVRGPLSQAASASYGVPISFSSARVDVTGEFTLEALEVGSIASADEVRARLLPGNPNVEAEVLVVRPELRLHVDGRGKSELNHLEHPRQRAWGSKDNRRTQSHPKVRIRVLDGVVALHFQGRGQLEGKSVQAHYDGSALHVASPSVFASVKHGEFETRVLWRGLAFDYQRKTGAHRFLAVGGSGQYSSRLGKGRIEDFTVARASEAHELDLSATLRSEEGAGTVRLLADVSSGQIGFGLDARTLPLSAVAPFSPPWLGSDKGWVSGSLEGAVSRSVMQASYKLSVEGLVLHADHLARAPVRVAGGVEGSASWKEHEGHRQFQLKLERAKLGQLRFSGALDSVWEGRRWPARASIQLKSEDIACDAALSSLPNAFRSQLAGLELRGKMQFVLDAQLSSDSSESTRLSVTPGLDRCTAVREPAIADTRRLEEEAIEHKLGDGSLRRVERTSESFVAIDELPSYVYKAFVAAEDARFFLHQGFDAHQIERSLAIDVAEGRFLRGGSTISQQLIKNLYLHRGRTFSRKLQEAILTWRLEENLSKEQILETYLNIIELGDADTFGILAASERWFGRHPKDLSILQTAFLAALTPEPTSMSKRIRLAQGLDERSSRRVQVILRAMRRSGVIDRREYDKARRETLSFAPHAFTLPSVAMSIR